MMQAWMRIWAIAMNTLREAIRNKLLYSLLFFAVGVIGAAVLVGSLSYVESERIIQDVGLSAIRLFGVGIAVFVGIGLIHGEVEQRTVYTILSKPVSRTHFLLGKFLGLTLTVWLQLALMSLAFAGVVLASDAIPTSSHLAALFMVGLELMLIVAVATLFSAFTTPMLASLFTIGVYSIGHLSRDLYQLGQQADRESVTIVATWIYRLVPDLETFNKTVEAAHGLPISPSEVGLSILYALGYTTALLYVASYIFRHRDMK